MGIDLLDPLWGAKIRDDEIENYAEKLGVDPDDLEAILWHLVLTGKCRRIDSEGCFDCTKKEKD